MRRFPLGLCVALSSHVALWVVLCLYGVPTAWKFVVMMPHAVVAGLAAAEWDMRRRRV